MAAVRQQFEQELQHFSQSLQALTMARNKFGECIEDIKSIRSPENEANQILVPASASLYIPGKIHGDKFMVDIGTGYFVDKSADEAIAFYEKKITKLNKEAVQIQNIIKEKTQSSMAVEAQIRKIAVDRSEGLIKDQEQKNTKAK